MQQKKSISVPKIGMNRDSNPSLVKNTEYVIGVNINSTNETGDELNVQNEPSNYYGVKFPDTYKVVGFEKDVLANKTYYLLASTEADENSPNYKRSSIGYVDDTVLETYNQDEAQEGCDECNSSNLLDTPLEDTVQVPSQEYIELEHDRCISLADIEELGLNFSINFPIKKIEIKQEKLGTFLYWNDFRNPMRYLNISNLIEAKDNSVPNYLHLQEVSCEETIETDCLLNYKLLVSPEHTRIKIEAKEEQIGGNLKQGTYEFRGAYCDAYGNEITEYSTPTNPISIWDENNVTQSQTTTDEFTNYAIKLNISNLDTEKFKYYKIAVVERNNVDNVQSVFLVGIFPTTDDVVVYTHSGSNNDDLYITRGNISVKKRMDFNTLNAIKPNYSKFKGTMVSDNRLWAFGAKEEEELNIQPVVNIFSSLLHWGTSAATENLYKSSIATSKYKGFMRNEVQPFSIRLWYNNGGYSANFPFIGRPKSTSDDEVVADNNLESLNSTTSSCNTNTRTKKWQIFNTAEAYEEVCNDFEDSGVEITDDITKTCTISEVATVPGDTITIPLTEEFIDLETYVENNSVPEITPYLEDTYLDTCTPSFVGECTTPSLTSEENVIGQITNEIVEFTEDDEKDVADYIKSIPPDYCSVYKRNLTDAGFIEDTDFTTVNKFTPCVNASPTSDRVPVYERDSNFLNESCSYLKEILTQSNPTQAISSTILNYDASETITDLYSVNSSFLSTTATGFFGNLHNKAQFFKIKKQNRDKIVLEFTKKADCLNEGDYYETVDNNEIRYTVYESCSAGATPFASGIVDLSTGELIELDITTLPNEFVVAVDAKIVSESILTACDDPLTARNVYHVAPPCSCFSIYVREIEYDSVTVSWDEIRIDKVMTYTSTCTFNLPNVNDCDPIPYRKGKMAYWESTIKYPDNKELYDSSNLNIRPSDLVNLTAKDLEEFLDYYVEGGSASPVVDGEGNYTLKDADFTCQNIRHFKFPDNTIAPFMIDNISYQKNADSIIFPLGIVLDNNVVNTMINVAYNNGLITKKQKESIVGWEVLRGDNSIHKSVIANGIAFDMYNYNKGNDTVHYSNFPFNDLGENKFCLNSDGGTIKHPYNGDKNHLFTFLSPDIFLNKPAIPTEVSLQGYMFGASFSEFENVDKHPQWTVLGKDSYTVSEVLAVAEVALEAAIKFAELMVTAQTSNWYIVYGGTSSGFGTGAAGVGAGTAIAGVVLGQLLASAIKLGQYRYDWLKIFRDLGRMDNFASFQVSSSKYNRLLTIPNNDSNYLRRLSIRKYLKDGDYNIIDDTDGETLSVNNWLRETSALISTNKDYPIVYPNDYKLFDNNTKNSNSSTFLATEVGCENNNKHQRDIASPYFSLKNWIPDQWDNIDSIKWLTTNNSFNLTEDTSCTIMYGGTVSISRFSWRRKVPLFTRNAINIADKLPFLYSRSSNIGRTRFYCNYETADDATKSFFGTIFPDIRSEYNFDCETGKNGFYLRPPSKFYLFVHSVANFLVESEVNCNFRYQKAQPKDWFYNDQNLSEWLQESNVSIVEPNTFYYNNSYTLPVSNSPFKKLDKTYNKEVWSKRTYKPNAWIWSEKDVNENSLVDPWLVFKPLNFWEDKTDRGRLIDLRSIESDQFLGRYENQLQLYNPANAVADAINNQNKELGTGFFASRPISFKKADLGFAGTQNTDFVSTPYGHFWVDAKRGRIFQVDQNGGNLEIISESVGGRPTNMKQWFREHLPFKILKYLPDVDIDNKFKGIGINMWYDDRNSRVFITKRDYVLKSSINKNDFTFVLETNQLLYQNNEVFFDNTTLFEDVSWTISYKPTEGSWNSYFTFYPDYSPYHQQYFQVGYNWGNHKETMWNHLLHNKSFCVFQGEYNPWVLEFPVTNENVNKILNSLSINIESKRYINEWDYSVHKDIGVTDMFIYNTTNNTGYLVLHPQKTLTDNRNYPKTEGNKQHILTTFEDGKQNVNYFYNRMINQDNNIPMFKKDKNNIFKEIDSRAVKFSGKKVLERMVGEVFIVNLSNTQDSRFNILIKNIINNETIYDS